MNICQIASLKVPKRLIVLYSQTTHTYTHRQEKARQVRLEADLVTSLGVLRALTDSVDDSCVEVVRVCSHQAHTIIMSYGVTRLLYTSSSQVVVHCCCAISSSNQDYVGVDDDS